MRITRNRGRKAGTIVRKRVAGTAMLSVILLLMTSDAAFAQSPRPVAEPSELAQQNMARVAASAGQISAILRSNAGLMVELKRWVAKDATDHGQLISDSDLTDRAIYSRLETDVQFRSIATVLLQRFGYLLPQVNPGSAQGKEQDLAIQERAKWIAEADEERLTAQRKLRSSTDLQETRACDRGKDPSCNTGSPSSETEGIGQLSAPLQQDSPAPPNPNGLAPNNDLPTLEKAQLIPSGAEEDALESTSLPVSGSYASILPMSSTGSRQVAERISSIPVSVDSNIESQGDADGGGNAPVDLPLRPTPNRSILSQAMLRQPDPYVDVPSLYDMYLQASPQPLTPERFGMELFQNGTHDHHLVPFDLPVGPDYVVGPGDSLAIDLWGGVSQRLLRIVDKEGRVSLPEAGPLLVSGESLAQVQESVQKTLRSQFRDVSVDVSLSRLRTIRVYVVGDVQRPGAYDISSLSTPLNALFVAGGPTSQGSLRILEHNRQGETVQSVDVYDLLLHGVKTDIERLENGDTVLVPPIGPEVTVEGMVRRPAVYELRNEKTLGDVLALAGGLLPTATLRHVEVQRVIAHQKRTMVSLDISPDANAETVTRQLDSFPVHDGDEIRIFPIAPYDQDALYLEGHVLRPGKYSYRPGMRVTDLISSYKDLLPEPATQYAEIIRLNPPDYKPAVESFNLADALSHPASAPALEPLDTVQIFGRFDFENPPTVSVWGDVRRPGTYRTSGQIHLGDAIHLAGGLSPDAEKQDAQVFHYKPNGQLEIFSVNLSQALAGNPASDIVLSSRDRILVHRNPADISPAAVYIKGEVGRPGRYPLTSNMRVADLIHAAGGLQPSADAEAADLTHYSWVGQKQITGQHDEIDLEAAMVSDGRANLPLSNGDVLTVRQLPGWNDLGATITVRGEVKHPGSYGIRPGERLSSILMRAGGFTPEAYPYGAILERDSVRDFESKSQQDLVDRIKDMEAELKGTPATDPNQKIAQDAAYAQWQETLENLTNNSPIGRLMIQISANTRAWANTSRDVAVRNGDTLIVPKRPSYVMVQGQVYNPTAISFRPGRSAKWYLSQSGGPTNLANKHGIFVVRADGTVIGGHGSSLWMGSALSESLQPGDTVVVPEKALGGPRNWQAFFQVVQAFTGITTSAILAARY